MRVTSSQSKHKYDWVFNHGIHEADTKQNVDVNKTTSENVI